jgi:hypothetical protein
MKELHPLADLTDRADLELLKQLVHSLADKNPCNVSTDRKIYAEKAKLL